MDEEIINAPEKFDYSQLLVPDRIVVQQKTTEIRERIDAAATNILQIGERLILVKEKLDHGMFSDWLGAEFFWTDRTARKFMQVARQFKTEPGSDLKISPSVLYLLSSNSTPEPVKRELIPKALTGETVTTKEVKEAIKKERQSAPEKPPQKKPDPSPEIIQERALEIRREKAVGKFDHLPEAIRPIFEEAVIFDQLLNHLTQASALFNKISGGNIEKDKGEAMACGTAVAKDYQEGIGLLKKLRHFISSRQPQNVCVYCRGVVAKMKTCKPCMGGGWSTAFQWRTATPSQREKENW